MFPSGAAIKGGLKTAKRVAPAAIDKMASKELAKGITPSRKALTTLSKISDAPITKSRVGDAAIRGAGIGAASVQADTLFGGDEEGKKRFATPLETVKRRGRWGGIWSRT